MWRSLPLPPLDADAVTTYLTLRFPQHALPAALVPWLLAHTDGNPLLLVTTVSALVEHGILAEHAGHWHLQRPLATVALGVPEGVRPLLEHQIERLPAALQQVLEVASVAGVTFAVAAVAAGLEASTAQIEPQCEALARYQLVQPVGLAHWPDGTVTTHYTFTHALYQQVAYARLGLGRRTHLHQQLALRLEGAYGPRTREIAVELAEHWARSHDADRAIRYLHQAAENAARRAAPQTVIALLTRAVALLRTLPETPARASQELALHVLLGPAWMATKGYAAPEVEQTYARARTLCAQLGETPQRFPVLRGLCQFYRNRGAFPAARAVGEELLQCGPAGGGTIPLAGGPGRTRGDLVSPRGVPGCLEPPPAGPCAHHAGGAARLRAGGGRGAWGAVSGHGRPDAVVPRLSGPGRPV